MWKRILKITCALVFVAGLLIFAFPFLNDWMVKRENARAIVSFDQEMKEMGLKEKEDDGETDEAGKKASLEELLAFFQKYNQELYETGQREARDPWSEAGHLIPMDESALRNGMLGYVEIPSIRVRLALYVGASEENLKKGAAWITWSSAPIGGDNVNSVIAAHRGYRGAAYFRHVDQLKVGDLIYVTNPWEKLTYRIEGFEIISPEETDKLLIREGEDRITLITCHPYTKNYQRFLVYGIREES